MRTRFVLAYAAALLVLAICSSCGGGGGGGGSAGEGDPASHADVAITWLDDESVTGWVVHWGAASRGYTHEVNVSKPASDADGNVTVIIAIDGEASSRFYFAITSYDPSGNASAFSNELSTDAITD
jgi:hypothetical protein